MLVPPMRESSTAMEFATAGRVWAATVATVSAIGLMTVINVKSIKKSIPTYPFYFVVSSTVVIIRR